MMYCRNYVFLTVCIFDKMYISLTCCAFNMMQFRLEVFSTWCTFDKFYFWHNVFSSSCIFDMIFWRCFIFNTMSRWHNVSLISHVTSARYLKDTISHRLYEPSTGCPFDTIPFRFLLRFQWKWCVYKACNKI